VSASVELGWLRPELDRCRELIATRSAPKRWEKSSSHGAAEVVTEVDLAVERLLIEAVGARMPTATVVSEESHPDPAALASDVCFVIDPIDGTEEFAAAGPTTPSRSRCCNADALWRRCSICRLTTSAWSAPPAPAPGSTVQW